MKLVAPVLPGETLGGKYRVERIVGHGGMGVVVSARHLALDERVAIKFLAGDPSDGAFDRFLREARAAAKVKGEHVCRVFDFGRLEAGEPYIVMEYLEGVDLARRLENDGPQPASLIAGWIIEACDALAEAHALGIVHRDLKPANIFLATRPDGSSCAKVLDFGISKLPSAERMTRTAATMGSPAYMSPEQLESSHDVDARSDVWSLGVVLYELLSGAPPFRAQSMIALALAIREEDPAPIVGIAPELERIVKRCLSKQPTKRYATVAELAADLAAFAPPDVAGLVARLARRKAATSSEVPSTAGEVARPLVDTGGGNDGRSGAAPRSDTSTPSKEGDAASSDNGTPPPPSPLAGSIAVVSGPAGLPKASARSTRRERVRADSEVMRSRGTFAPLQSTMDEERSVGTRRARRLAIAAAAALLAVASVGGRAAMLRSEHQRADAHVDTSSAPPSPTVVDTGGPPASTTPGSTDIPAPAPSTSSSSRRSTTTMSPPARIGNTAAPSTTREAALPAALTASTTPSASPPAAPSAIPAPTEQRGKRRELDRGDPL